MADPIAEQVLREIQTLPTNNLTRIFRHAGKTAPESVGGGCLWAAARLARLLRQRKPGIRIGYHNLGTPGSHGITISDDKSERLLFEPSLFQVQPFSLTRFEADPSQCYCDTHPLQVPFPTRMKFAWAKPGHVLEMSLVSIRGYPNRSFQYVLDTPVAVDEDDPYGALPIIDEQQQIYIYALGDDGHKYSVTMNVRSRHINVAKVGDRMYVDSEPGFGSRFEKMAERLELSDAALRDLLAEAVEHHNRFYPGH